MALLINCPGCGETIVNNGEKCPFCGFDVKSNQAKEEAEHEENTSVKETTEETQQASAPAADVGTNVVDNPDLPNLDDGEKKHTLPPMQQEQPVPISKIANTPAVPLTPIQSEKINNTLPKWQPQQEVTIEQIQHTPAVQLDPIQQEKVQNKLPDINSPEAAPPRSVQPPMQGGPQISVERPAAQPVQPQRPQINVERPAAQPQRPQINVERPFGSRPQINVEKPATPIQPIAPRVQPVPQQPQRPTAPVQPQSAAPQTPPPVRPQNPQWTPAPQQPQTPAPQPKKQWTTEAKPEPSEEKPQPKQKKQWSAEPSPAEPSKEKKQWSATPKPADGGEVDEYEELRRKFDSGRNTTPPEATRTPVNTPANNTPAQNTPQKKPVVPIIIVAVLVIALIAIVVFAMGGNGDSETESSSQTSSSSAASDDTSSADTSTAGVAATVTFTKPDDWGDDIYAYVYENGGNTENAEWPGVAMTKNDDGTYTYTTPDNIPNAVIIFNDGKDTNQYPAMKQPGLEIKDGNNYTVSTEASSSEGTAITFTKPDDWGDDVNAYIYITNDNKLSDWPGEAMTKTGDNTYSIDVPSEFEGGYVIFNYTDENGKSKAQHPKRGQGLIIVAGKAYTTETVDE